MASQTFHDSHGDTYERMASNSTSSIAKIFLAELTPPITASSYILDNACGPGVVTQFIKAAHPSVRIKACDLAPAMTALVETKVAERGWVDVETAVLDVRDLKTLQDETFSHVITNFGFAPDTKNLKGPGIAATEMYRVLKEEGVAVVTTWSERNFTAAMEAAALEIRPDEKPFAWTVPDEWAKGWWLMQRLDEAGFGNKVSVKSVEGRMEAESVEALAGNLMLFKDMFYKGYSEEELKRVEEALVRELVKVRGFER